MMPVSMAHSRLNRLVKLDNWLVPLSRSCCSAQIFLMLFISEAARFSHGL